VFATALENSALYKDKDPVEFMIHAFQSKVVAPFAKLLLQMPIASADSERAWAAYSRIWSDTRINLRPKTRHLLACVYWNLRREFEVEAALKMKSESCSDEIN